MCHTAGHHGHEFGVSEFRQEWANGHRSFRLSHKNAGSNVKRLCAAGTHDARHRPSRNPDDELHNAVVVENCKERADEDYRGQHLEGENKTDARTLLAQRTEDEFRTDEGVTENAIRSVSGDLKDAPAVVHAQHKNGKGDLQAESPGDRLDADGAAIRGKNVGEREHRQQPKNSRESSHSAFLLGPSDDSVDERPFLRWRRIGYNTACLDKLSGPLGLSLVIVVNRS